MTLATTKQDAGHLVPDMMPIWKECGLDVPQPLGSDNWEPLFNHRKEKQ